MKRNETKTVIESTRILLLAAACLLAANATAVDSTFTYQGELTDNGTPVNGTVDVNFTLFDAATDGIILQEVVLVDVVVNDGRFTAEVPLERTHFDGSERFLEIAVANPAGGSFEVLDPRQRISPAPYAIFADGAPGTDIDPSNFWSIAGNAAAAGDFLGTTNTTPLELRVNGVRALQVVDEIDSVFGVHAPNWTAGSEENVLGSGIVGATIGGGGGDPDDDSCGPDNNSACVNTVSGNYATVVGGFGNYATGFRSTAMGSDTTASGSRSTAMGSGTTASGSRSTAMGNITTSSGLHSTAMGSITTASGDRSMAMGTRAIAGHDGTLVWADATFADFASTGEDQFLIRAGGGVGIGTNAPSSPLTVAGAVESTSGGFRFPDDSVQTTAAPANLWQTSGSDIFYNDGNVSIGTTNITDRFRVDGPGVFKLSGTDSSTVPLLQFRSTGNNADWVFRHDNDKFYLQTEASAGNELVTFQASGQVGIGTTSPDAALHARSFDPAGIDIIAGGNDSTNAGDDGIVASDPDAPSSDLFLRSNDAVVVKLDHDGDGEDADFIVRDKDDNMLLNVDDGGAISIAPTTRWRTLTYDVFQLWGPVGFNWFRRDSDLSRGIGGLDDDNVVMFSAPLRLPHGSEIKSFTAQVVDNSPQDEIEVCINRRTVSSQSATALIACDASGILEAPGETTLSKAASGSVASVNNQGFGYFVLVAIEDVPSGSFADHDIRFYSITVEYETTSVLP